MQKQGLKLEMVRVRKGDNEWIQIFLNYDGKRLNALQLKYSDSQIINALATDNDITDTIILKEKE